MNVIYPSYPSEFKAPSLPHTYQGSAVQYPPTEIENTPFYPALPGVALAPPSVPLTYSFVAPLEDVSLPSVTTISTDSPLSLPAQAPKDSVVLTPEIEVSSSVLPAPESPHVESFLAMAAQPINHSTIQYLVPDEIHNAALELPDAPSQVPLIFPAAPTHTISRGLDTFEPESIETSERATAMSGRNPSSNNSRADRTPNQIATPAISSSASYPQLPVVPAFLPSNLDDSNTRAPSRAASVSVSSLNLSQQDPRRVRISPLYTPESQFPPTNRRYACQEAEALERRLCHSILVHESATFQSKHNIKCSGSCQVTIL